ncbi:MAG: hypothetical protein WBA39_34005 [Rivularia sp. (in: cyanobacteria)]
MIKKLNPLRIIRAAIFRYRTRNDVFLIGSKYCYRCHQNVDYDSALACPRQEINRCPMDALPF